MLITTLASGSAKGFGFSLGAIPDQLFYLVAAGGGPGASGNGGGGGGAGGFRTNLPTQTSGGTPGNPESIIPALLRLAPGGIFGPRVNVTFTGSFTRTPFSSNTLAQICVDSKPPPPRTISSPG